MVTMAVGLDGCGDLVAAIEVARRRVRSAKDINELMPSPALIPLVAVASCWLPTLRATQLDRLETLRFSKAPCTGGPAARLNLKKTALLRHSVTLGFAIAAALCAQAARQFTDVPYVPTPANVVDAMLDLADIKPPDGDCHVRPGRSVRTTCVRRLS